MWLAAKYPEAVKSQPPHSAWDKTDPFLRVIVEDWRTMAGALDSDRDGHPGDLPVLPDPELYAARPEYVDSLAEFVLNPRCRRYAFIGSPVPSWRTTRPPSSAGSRPRP